jgi:hypothetical protein
VEAARRLVRAGGGSAPACEPHALLPLCARAACGHASFAQPPQGNAVSLGAMHPPRPRFATPGRSGAGGGRSGDAQRLPPGARWSRGRARHAAAGTAQECRRSGGAGGGLGAPCTGSSTLHCCRGPLACTLGCRKLDAPCVRNSNRQDKKKRTYVVTSLADNNYGLKCECGGERGGRGRERPGAAGQASAATAMAPHPHPGRSRRRPMPKAVLQRQPRRSSGPLPAAACQQGGSGERAAPGMCQHPGAAAASPAVAAAADPARPPWPHPPQPYPSAWELAAGTSHRRPMLTWRRRSRCRPLP